VAEKSGYGCWITLRAAGFSNHFGYEASKKAIEKLGVGAGESNEIRPFSAKILHLTDC